MNTIKTLKTAFENLLDTTINNEIERIGEDIVSTDINQYKDVIVRVRQVSILARKSKRLYLFQKFYNHTKGIDYTPAIYVEEIVYRFLEFNEKIERDNFNKVDLKALFKYFDEIVIKQSENTDCKDLIKAKGQFDLVSFIIKK